MKELKYNNQMRLLLSGEMLAILNSSTKMLQRDLMHTNKGQLFRYLLVQKLEETYTKKEAKNLDAFLDYKNIKNNNGILGNCKINIINNNYQKIKILNEETLISPIKIKSKNYDSEIKLGQIYEKNFIIKKEALLTNVEELLVIQKK